MGGGCPIGKELNLIIGFRGLGDEAASPSQESSRIPTLWFLLTPPHHPPPLPGSDVTASRVGRGGAGLWLRLRGRKLRGGWSRGGGSGRCSGNRDARVPASCALSPEAVRGCGGDVAWGGGRFGVWARRGVDRDARTGVGCEAPVGCAGSGPWAQSPEGRLEHVPEAAGLWPPSPRWQAV